MIAHSEGEMLRKRADQGGQLSLVGNVGAGLEW